MNEYRLALGARLRAIRAQQGLSLQAVEQKSEGRWKAIVVGSYERGDRAVSVEKLAELARFYGIPAAELLPGPGPVHRGGVAGKLVLDLRRLAELPDELAGPLARFVATIQRQRDDYNGRMLSIRGEDLKPLAILYDTTAGELTDRMISWGVLAPTARPTPEELVDQLLRDVEARIRLERAMGVIAEQTGVQIAQASDVLRGFARDQGIDLDDATTAIVEGTLRASPEESLDG